MDKLHIRIEDYMQAGEIIVVRLKGGIGIGRFIETNSKRIKLSVGRNREAQLPVDRLILATGVIVSGMEDAEAFRRQCESISSGIDLTEVWELMQGESAPMSVDDLAELYWGTADDVEQKVALLYCLEDDTLHFVEEKEGYLARSVKDVQEVLDRRQREAENARAAESLMEHLERGKLPEAINSHQTGVLQQLRAYAIHGENYNRSASVRGLLEKVSSSTRDLQKLSFDLLVSAGEFSIDEPLELERAGVPETFGEDALAESVSIDLSKALGETHRKDLTSLLTITIDDEGTSDRDDALSLEIDEGHNEQTQPVYRIGVHIADAGTLITPGSALDREADRRMATLYLPERKIHMLPSEISDSAGSLNPGESRVALSLLARLTESGDLLDWEVVPSVVRSDAALSYDEADQAISDAVHPRHDMLASLNRLAQSLRQKREAAGAIKLPRPEMTIKVTESGEVTVKVVPRSTAARGMVAEFMILCNSLLAEFCMRENLPAAYRSQVAPDLRDMDTDLPEGPLRWYILMRRFPPADMDLVPAPHGGLGVSAYLQATSPLRRYPDLVMQRQISRFLGVGTPFYTPEEIASVAQRAEVQLKELARLEDVRKQYWFLKFLHQNYLSNGASEEDALFQAVVLENQPGRTALLELIDYPFRVRASLPDTVFPGDTITLKIHGVDLWRRVGQFVHVPEQGLESGV